MYLKTPRNPMDTSGQILCSLDCAFGKTPWNLFWMDNCHKPRTWPSHRGNCFQVSGHAKPTRYQPTKIWPLLSRIPAQKSNFSKPVLTLFTRIWCCLFWVFRRLCFQPTWWVVCYKKNLSTCRWHERNYFKAPQWSQGISPRIKPPHVLRGSGFAEPDDFHSAWRSSLKKLILTFFFCSLE